VQAKFFSSEIAMITFDAHFDGEALRPDSPVVLPQNVQLRVTVFESEPSDQNGDSIAQNPRRPLGLFERIAQKHGLIEGPEDWSSEIDHYLYGTPKRGDQQAD
jgi:hypothetical protein